MNQGHIQQEIRWSTKHVYVDIETGEKIEKEKVAAHYHIVKIKKHKNVYKSKGTITFTNECRWAGYVQGKLWD